MATLVFLLVLCGAASAQIYTDPYDFNGTNGDTPGYPQVLAQGRDGTLYGTTSGGGISDEGVVFSVTPAVCPSRILGDRFARRLPLRSGGNGYFKSSPAATCGKYEQ